MEILQKTENISNKFKIFRLTDRLSLHNMAASSCLSENVYPINFLLKMYIFIILLLLLLISIGIIFKFPTAADLPIGIQGFKTNVYLIQEPKYFVYFMML